MNSASTSISRKLVNHPIVVFRAQFLDHDFGAGGAPFSRYKSTVVVVVVRVVIVHCAVVVVVDSTVAVVRNV